MDVLPRLAARPALQSRSNTVVLLLLAAVAHAAFGVYTGITDDGDYSLLIFAAPLIAMTALAALCSARGAATASFKLTQVSLAFALMLLFAYGLGLAHLLQSAFAYAIAWRSLAREAPN